MAVARAAWAMNRSIQSGPEHFSASTTAMCFASTPMSRLRPSPCTHDGQFVRIVTGAPWAMDSYRASRLRCSIESVMSGLESESVPASEQQWGTSFTGANPPTSRRRSHAFPESESWQGAW